MHHKWIVKTKLEVFLVCREIFSRNLDLVFIALIMIADPLILYRYDRLMHSSTINKQHQFIEPHFRLFFKLSLVVKEKKTLNLFRNIFFISVSERGSNLLCSLPALKHLKQRILKKSNMNILVHSMSQSFD